MVDTIPEDFLESVAKKDNQPFTPFCPELDQRLPIEKALSAESRAMIADGKIEPFAWTRNFNDAGVKNAEAEITMGRILTEAVNAGEWVKVPQPKDSSLDAFLPGVEEKLGARPSEMFGKDAVSLQFERAGKILARENYVKFETDDDGLKYLAPTEKLVDYVGKKGW